MDTKLKDVLMDGEQLLWSGSPVFKTLGETHKTMYGVKAVIIVGALIAFLCYYMKGVMDGLIAFKAMAIVIMLVLAAVPLMLEWLDAQKMKKTVYAVTDSRLIAVVDTAVNVITYDKIKDYKFAADADGQVSLVCGCDMMKASPRSYRASCVYGVRMKGDGSECERFVMYALPEPDAVAELVNKRIK